jgi:hypothetical protein
VQTPDDGEIRVAAEVRVSGSSLEAMQIASAQLAQAISTALASASSVAGEEGVAARPNVPQERRN